MKYFSESDLENLDRVFRINLINGVTGYKPANLIATHNSTASNLCIISSVLHLGSHPPLIGFLLRPATVPRHTYENIKENPYYTINHIPEAHIQQAHYTSVKFDKNVSEFEQCQFSEEYLHDFPCPFVRESQIKIGMKWTEEFIIKSNNTIFMVGKVQCIILPDSVLADTGHLDLNSVNDVCISGCDQYHTVQKIAQFPHAKKENLPDFKMK